MKGTKEGVIHWHAKFVNDVLFLRLNFHRRNIAEICPMTIFFGWGISRHKGSFEVFMGSSSLGSILGIHPWGQAYVLCFRREGTSGSKIPTGSYTAR